jgi:hypothetical protein
LIRLAVGDQQVVSELTMGMGTQKCRLVDGYG